MRYIIMHRTNAHWEAGAAPSSTLIASVGRLIGECARTGALQGAEGLRPSSEGARLTVSAGRRTLVKGPFENGHAVPAGFTIVRVRSIDEAVEYASRQADVLGDGEFQIRPVTEPWDIGMGSKPPDLTTRRYMILRTAADATGARVEPLRSGRRTRLSEVIDEAIRAGACVATEIMRPTSRGRRYINSQNGISFFDGPFTESKELIGGYIIVSADSLNEAHRWAERYVRTVEADEVDVRELE